MGFPGGSSGEESTCQCRRRVSVPGLWRSPGVGNGTLLQCSYLGDSMGGGAWWGVMLQSTGPQRIGHAWVTEHKSYVIVVTKSEIIVTRKQTFYFFKHSFFLSFSLCMPKCKQDLISEFYPFEIRERVQSHTCIQAKEHVKHSSDFVATVIMWIVKLVT